MNPLMAHLIIALLAGTSNWQDAQFIEFFDNIETVMIRDDITLKDIEIVVESFNKQIPWIQGDDR